MFKSEWLPQPEALKALSLSRTSFWRLRAAGIISGGAHYYRVSRSKRSPLVVNVPAVRLALAVHLGH